MIDGPSPSGAGSARTDAAAARPVPPLERGIVLFACDLSPHAAAALAPAQALAAAFGGELAAVHVMPTTMPASRAFPALANPALLSPTRRGDFRRALEGVLQPARAASLSARAILREGRPADEVLGVAAALPASIIVVGTHGRRAIDRALLGTVAEKVIGRSSCPVLAVPPAFEMGRRAWPRVVLAATDFSADAAEAVARAASIAAKTGARLVVAHVVEGRGSRAKRLRAEGRLRAGLPGAAEVAIAGNSGRLADDILAVATAHAADLLVVGAARKPLLGRALFGSTAVAVVRSSTCPVLVVAAEPQD